MFLSTIIASLAAAALVPAAPTPTATSSPSRTVTLTGITHSVVAGRGGAPVFDPDNVVAEVGDTVEWHFLPGNHSVAQSSFGQPCVPPTDAGAGATGQEGQPFLSSFFFSGFHPVASGAAQAPDVFQLVVVQDDDPIWYYCAQASGGDHCRDGMAGVVNQDYGSSDTLSAYKKAAAALTGVSVVPPVVQGGAVIPNPNPNSGYL